MNVIQDAQFRTPNVYSGYSGWSGPDSPPDGPPDSALTALLEITNGRYSRYPEIS